MYQVAHAENASMILVRVSLTLKLNEAMMNGVPPTNFIFFLYGGLS